MGSLLKQSFLPLTLILAVTGCTGTSGNVREEHAARMEREHPLWESHVEDGRTAARERRFSEAEREFIAAIGSLTVVQGNESRLVSSLNELAMLYSAGGRHNAAEETLGKALAFSEGRSGESHPDTLMTLQNLAAIHANQGHYDVAEGLYRRALTLWEKSFGKDHPAITTCLESLSRVYDRLGRPEDARALRTRANAVATLQEEGATR